MRVVRRAYVNDVDRRICHDRFPIIDGGFPTEGFRCSTCLGPITSTNRRHPDIGRQIKKARCLPPGIGMGATHELRSDERD